VSVEEDSACLPADTTAIWQAYAATRPYLASSPAAQAASIVTSNRQAIVKDAIKPRAGSAPDLSETQVGEALRTLVDLLLENASVGDLPESIRVPVATLTASLDKRMCIPRDMGALSAACIKKLAVELRQP
jgi:hypothetical protein